VTRRSCIAVAVLILLGINGAALRAPVVDAATDSICAIDCDDAPPCTVSTIEIAAPRMQIVDASVVGDRSVTFVERVLVIAPKTSPPV
jgi:hypothetical protein